MWPNFYKLTFPKPTFYAEFLFINEVTFNDFLEDSQWLYAGAAVLIKSYIAQCAIQNPIVLPLLAPSKQNT